MIETMYPMHCPKCQSKKTTIVNTGANYTYSMQCDRCLCGWIAFNRTSALTHIEIIKEGQR
jgi:ssDNA-binding Zn-finger/Zn-ribbon topoisomerase 1